MADLSAQAALFDAAALSQDIVILEELRRHVRQSQAGRALLDATLDFELYKVLPWTIKGWRSPNDLRGRFDFLRRYYRDMGRAGENYVTFFENHDGGQGDRYPADPAPPGTAGRHLRRHP